VPFLRPGIRVEERRTPDTYVLRAELPGVDPAPGAYTSPATTACCGCKRGRSSATAPRFRTITLPSGAREDEIIATYANPILEIRVPVSVRPAVTEVTIAASEDEES
jgi:HSP20 family protein